MPHGRRTSFTLSPTKRRSIVGAVPPPLYDSPRSSKQSPAGDVPAASRRYSSVNEMSVGSENVFLDVPENNDEKEKRERQLSRLQQLQSRNFSSPTTTPSDRRKSVNVSGLSNQQLSEHYTKCIQLSTENKISVKNAFNLQLIDYMSEMLKRKDSDMNNFQVASCTLDASTKIYAYRVDSIHTDTLKMAGGLGRTQDKDGKKTKDSGMDDGNDGVEGEKRKRKVKKKAVIETNLKNINVTKFDLEFDVDPLFKKTTSQFDEGRSGSGQFLNSLQLQDDKCFLMLDSEAIIMNTGNVDYSPKSEMVLIPKPADLSQAVICPTFAPFEFTTWKIGDEDSFLDTSGLQNDIDNEEDYHNRFDPNAIPEPLHDVDVDDDFGVDLANDEDCTENGTVITIGQQGCQRAPPPLMEAVHLKEHLSLNPSEYSYFDNKLLSAWAGPGHWRIRPLSKVKSVASSKEDESKKTKKEVVTLRYEEKEDDPQLSALFAITKKTTKLSYLTLKTWSKEKTTLPIDLHYEARSFTKLFGRPAIIIQRQKKPAAVDDNVQEYDYDNRNDRDNYCADLTDADDGGSGYGDNSMPGYDMTEIFSQTVMGTQPINGEGPDKAVDFMENLVAAPNKVAKINIGYARTAKKVDMKKLKSAMWNMLADPTNNKENNNQVDKEMSSSAALDKMDPKYNIEFSNLYKNLPRRLSSKMAENLSVPLAFIALLHLANEHMLKLCDKGNLEDFSIMQG